MNSNSTKAVKEQVAYLPTHLIRKGFCVVLFIYKRDSGRLATEFS